MKIPYTPKHFTDTHLAVINQAERICQRYADQGYNLTLRQVFYQFIAGDFFPESRRDASGTKNTELNYKWLGNLLSDARLAGLIDWEHMVDRTRSSAGGDSGYGSPERAIELMSGWYNITHWDGQENYVEVWVEKEALIDVIQQTASRWDVASMACKGYVSLSAMHESALRIRRQERAGKNCHILYLGDHDPSGIDMSRDVADRLATFNCHPEIHRIALNMDQIEELNPPPSPAKLTDPRSREYVEIYGDDSWELDALDPATLDALVDTNIVDLLDMDLRTERLAREERERQTLIAVSDHFETVLTHLRGEGLLNEEDDDDE